VLNPFGNEGFTTAAMLLLGPVSSWVLCRHLIQSIVAAMQSTPIKEQAVFS
jgi:hypothetical protein